MFTSSKLLYSGASLVKAGSGFAAQSVQAIVSGSGSVGVAAAADVDGDGNIDLLLGTNDVTKPNQLWLNTEGTGVFTRAEHATCDGAPWAGNQQACLSSKGTCTNPASVTGDRAACANGGGLFTPTAIYVSVYPMVEMVEGAKGAAKGAVFGDFNEDGRPDLYVGNLHGDDDSSASAPVPCATPAAPIAALSRSHPHALPRVRTGTLGARSSTGSTSATSSATASRTRGPS